MIKVLVIDDHQQQAEIISQFMQTVGFNSEYLTESDKALDKIRDNTPDVIILDIMMPKLDGLTLLKQIRDDDQLKHIKIMIYTAKNFHVDRRKAIDLGADLFIAKPTRGTELINYVKNLAGAAAS